MELGTGTDCVQGTEGQQRQQVEELKEQRLVQIDQREHLVCHPCFLVVEECPEEQQAWFATESMGTPLSQETETLRAEGNKPPSCMGWACSTDRIRFRQDSPWGTCQACMGIRTHTCFVEPEAEPGSEGPCPGSERRRQQQQGLDLHS